jgi:hypothetical protein
VYAQSCFTVVSAREYQRCHGVQFAMDSVRPLSQLKLKMKLNYDRQSVGQSVLVSGVYLGPVANFSFPLIFSLDSCGFVIL